MDRPEKSAIANNEASRRGDSFSFRADALIFDLDGTLLDTVADIGAACEHTLEKHGFPGHELSAYKKMVGNGFDKLVERAIGYRPENIGELVRETKEYYNVHLTERSRPYPRMAETLRDIARRGTRLAVLSNKPDEMSKTIINHYFPDIPFEYVIGAIEGVPLKPDPSSLKRLLDRMNVASERAAYCGDSDVDMITASAAGICAIGAGWGFRGAKELLEAGAKRVFAEPRELATISRV